MKISLHVCLHIKTIPWKFPILNPNNSRVIFWKSRLIFNIFCCFWIFVNKLLIYLTCAYLKKYRCRNVKSSTYYFHMKTKILKDFQICISVPLIHYLFIYLFNLFSFIFLIIVIYISCSKHDLTITIFSINLHILEKVAKSLVLSSKWTIKSTWVWKNLIAKRYQKR